MADGENVWFDPVPAGGTVWYTLDGSDPLTNGVLSATALEYDPATGFALPAEGATVRARAVEDGTWSALEDVKLASQPPETVPLQDALRVAALYTSTTDGGDAGEFIVLTNLSAEASVVLSGGRLVAWNAAKKTEADPSLQIAFDGLAIGPGGSLTLDQATHFGAKGKLTNSQVGLRVYDATNGLVQEVYVDADWWEGACDGTGRWFVAADFGSEAKTDVQWTPSPAAPAIPLPEDATAKDAVLAAIGDNADIGDWLVGIGTNAVGGYTAITNFTGTKADIELCYFLDILPDSNPEIELAIPSISFDEDGNPVVEGELLNHGEEVETTIRGTALLYYADALEDLATTTNRIQLDPPAFPAETTNDMSGATVPGARFYRLRIER